MKCRTIYMGFHLPKKYDTFLIVSLGHFIIKGQGINVKMNSVSVSKVSFLEKKES